MNHVNAEYWTSFWQSLKENMLFWSNHIGWLVMQLVQLSHTQVWREMFTKCSSISGQVWQVTFVACNNSTLSLSLSLLSVATLWPTQLRHKCHNKKHHSPTRTLGTLSHFNLQTHSVWCSQWRVDAGNFIAGQLSSVPLSGSNTEV